MKKDIHMTILICFIFLCAAGYLFYHGQQKTEEPEITVSDDFSNEKKENRETSETARAEMTECAVCISGAVLNPGVYRYTGKARLGDAVEALGGFTANAAKDTVNLAEVLEDGEQIIILTKKQAKKKKAEEKEKETTDNVPADGEKRVNINQATKEELMSLPGIGEAKAALIVNYRTEHGNFSKPEDIMQISGIKEGIYQKIKDYITT